MKKITNWAFFLALASAMPVIGQDYLIPVNPSTNGATCGSPPFLVVAQTSQLVSCGRAGYFHWFAVGGGWATALTLSNPTSSDMVVQISILGTDGVTAKAMTLVRNGTALGVQSAETHLLPKHGSIRWELTNGGAATETNGQVLVQVLAKDALSLQSVRATEDYSYTNAARIVFSTVTLPIVWIDQAQASFTATFEESSADGSLGSFAIKDMSGSASGQTVDVQAFDLGGNLLGDKTVVLTPGQVVAKTSDDLFGANTFKSLSPSPIARLQFNGAGAINVLVLQVRGQSLASLPATAVLEQ
jgi:hypothetical protein